MPTSCSVPGCTNRHDPSQLRGFFRFPRADKERLRLWLAAVNRQRVDGSRWLPGPGDRICGDHFVTGRPSFDRTHPDYAPSLKLKLNASTLRTSTRKEMEVAEAVCCDCVVSGESTSGSGSTFANSTLSRYERTRKRCQQRQELIEEEKRWRTEHDLRRKQLLSAIENDHDYLTSSSHDQSQVSLGVHTVTEPVSGDKLSSQQVDLPILLEVGVNTDISIQPDNVEDLRLEAEMLVESEVTVPSAADGETKVCGPDKRGRVFSMSLIKDNDQKTKFYTGLPTYIVFSALLAYLHDKAEHLQEWRGSKETSVKPQWMNNPWQKQLPIADQFFSVLCRLRLDLHLEDISDRLGMSLSSFSRMFTTWIAFLSRELDLLFPWPSRERINSWMPDQFFHHYPSVRIVIDCMELQCQRPTSLMSQSSTYSNYKSRNTFKLLVGISPSGLITFLSPLWGGRVSDREITASSSVIDHLNDGDSVMADRGFDIEDLLATRGVRLNIPPRLAGRTQFTCKEVETTRRIAEQRIHVERAIGRARRYDILNSVMPLSMAGLSDHIVKVCFLLTNFDQPLVK